MDLLIRGGTVVTVGSRADVDVGINDGRVVQMGGLMSAEREIDATGHIVTPGGVDPHVHLTPPTRRADGWKWSDDFESGTRAAVAGGITTVGNMSFGLLHIGHISSSSDGFGGLVIMLQQLYYVIFF